MSAMTDEQERRLLALFDEIPDLDTIRINGRPVVTIQDWIDYLAACRRPMPRVDGPNVKIF